MSVRDPNEVLGQHNSSESLLVAGCCGERDLACWFVPVFPCSGAPCRPGEPQLAGLSWCAVVCYQIVIAVLVDGSGGLSCMGRSGRVKWQCGQCYLSAEVWHGWLVHLLHQHRNCPQLWESCTCISSVCVPCISICRAGLRSSQGQQVLGGGSGTFGAYASPRQVVWLLKAPRASRAELEWASLQCNALTRSVLRNPAPLIRLLVEQ